MRVWCLFVSLVGDVNTHQKMSTHRHLQIPDLSNIASHHTPKKCLSPRVSLRQNPGAAGVHKRAKSQFSQHQQPGCPHTWAGFSLCHAPPPWLLAPLLKYTGTQGLNNRSAAWQQGHGVVYAEICSGNLRAGYNCNDRTQHPAVLNPPTT